MKRAIALSLSIALAMPAAAQVPDREELLGSRIPVKVDRQAQEVAQLREVHQRFGDCVVKRHYDEAVTYLLLHPTADNDDRQVRRLIGVLGDGDCLVAAADFSPDGVVMTMPGDTMRYALADALVRRDFAQSPVADLDRVAPLVHPRFDPAKFQSKPGKRASAKQLAEQAQDGSNEQARIYLSHFGECVVRVAPAKSHALLMASVNSPAEDVAFAALSPRLRECVFEGQTITLNKGVIRGAVGHGYYRLAKAPRLAVPAALSVPR